MLSRMKAWLVRLLIWMVSTAFPAESVQPKKEPRLREPKERITVAQMKREARKRRNIEKRKKHGTRN